MSKLKLWWSLFMGKKLSLHKILKESEATLYITKPDYAYLEVDGVKYYFHNSEPRVVRYKDITTLDGQELKQSVVPYDGWGRSL